MTITNPLAAANLDASENWRTKAACLDEDPYLWHPLGESRLAFADALNVCRECPVSRLCLEYALKTEVGRDGEPLSAQQRFGMYGGQTPRDRARIAAVSS